MTTIHVKEVLNNYPYYEYEYEIDKKLAEANRAKIQIQIMVTWKFHKMMLRMILNPHDTINDDMKVEMTKPTNYEEYEDYF